MKRSGKSDDLDHQDDLDHESSDDQDDLALALEQIIKMICIECASELLDPDQAIFEQVSVVELGDGIVVLRVVDKEIDEIMSPMLEAHSPVCRLYLV